MRTDVPHQAGVADREFLGELTAACKWWSRQRTWRVTSSFTGGGVIAEFEHLVARRVARDALALALPSATAALVTGLRALNVAPGAVIGVPALDGIAARAAAGLLGIRTRALPVDRVTGLLDPARLEQEAGLAAVIAVHRHGIACDVPGLRQAWPEVPVIEDAAGAFAARYPAGRPVGSAADACAFSFNAAKTPSAGELGCLVTRNPGLHTSAVELTQHPVRQLVAGVTSPKDDQPMMRVAPAVALLGAYAVQRHTAQVPLLRQAGAQLAADLAGAGLDVLTDPDLHAPGVIAVRADATAVRAALRDLTLAAGVTVASVRQPELRVHPDAAGDPDLAALARAIVTITLTCRRTRHVRQFD
jgi:hypothetical protein